MKRSLVVLCALGAATAVVACGPPQAASNNATSDVTTGTLKVWLFEEPNNGPKEAVVNEAVQEFQAGHDDVTVDVQYIAGESRAERMTGAFNDPASAPDVVEYGNTDMANYVAVGGLADITGELDSWEEGKDLDPDIVKSTEVDGRRYGLPWYTGVRALYYRTDVFAELGLQPPRTLAELTEHARRIRAAKPDLYGISVGGKYIYGLTPMIWANGGELATEKDGRHESALNTPESKAGIAQYTGLLRDDICPPSSCAQMTGSQSVQAFAAGKAAMTIGGDFNRSTVDAGDIRDKYAVVPLPGVTAGSIAPAFAGGNNLGLLRSSQHRTLGTQFVELLGGRTYQQKLFEAMTWLPTFTDLQNQVTTSVPAEKPFVDTIRAGTRFVPVDKAWATIDAQSVLPTMMQEIATGAKSLDDAVAAASTQMNSLFSQS
jgi:N,N'-diacetylchitobiose transport system substrate-binding protein